MDTEIRIEGTGSGSVPSAGTGAWRSRGLIRGVLRSVALAILAFGR